VGSTIGTLTGPSAVCLAEISERRATAKEDRKDLVKADPGLKREDADNALYASEARYRRLFETAQDGILILDARTGFILDVNPFLISLLDYSREDFIGKTLWDIGPFRQIQESKAAFRELQQKEYIRYEDLPLETRSGRRVYVEFVSNVYGVNGERVIQCNIRDITARKESERILAAQAIELARQAEDLEYKTMMLQSVLDSMTEGLVVADAQGSIVIWNPAASKMFGLGAANVGIQEWSPHFGIYLPDKVTPFPSEQLPLARAIRGETTSALIFVHNPERIEDIFAEANASPLKDKRGIVNGGVVTFRDVTANNYARETLREYQRVVEGLEEMLLVVDRRYRYVIANRAFLNFCGRPAGQVIGHFVEEVASKDVFALMKEKMDDCFRGNVVRCEMACHSPGSGKRDLSVSYFPIEGATGVDRIACVLQDITLRKLAEGALRRSEERFSKAFRSNPLAITISTKAEGRYLDVNDAFLELLGYSREDVIGHTAADLRFWSEPLDRMEMLRYLNEKQQVTKRHMRYRTAKGEVREAEVWVESIELDGQSCLLKITRDVTEIQQLEAQFRQAQKMEAVGRLAGGVAHDFNNILSIILGYSDLSLDLIEPENPVSRYLAETKRAAKRAALLTQQLLVFSRRQVIFPKNLDLNDVVHRIFDMFLRLVGEDVKIEFRPATLMGSIKADPGQIEQVLMNLVVNARDAMPTGGKIIIETGEAELDEVYVSRHPGSHAGKYVVLVVSDTGCGMDEQTKPQIFEPFFTTKAAGQGTGLGLSTVYGIVKQSAGYILVYSEVGKGTTFKIYFPRLAEKADALDSFREEDEPPRGSETILVVEDDNILREITAKLLQDAGYRVVDAKDAEDALKIVAASPAEIDLLLTDVIMPGSSGVDLAKLAAGGHPKLRLLFMSGYTGDLVGRQGVLLQQDSFLEKPFTKRSLLAKVYSVLHDESATRQSH
jgi:two-component system, cell cycle sensor histidine kinase and response regulator CckA